jgi:hypothetical protein
VVDFVAVVGVDLVASGCFVWQGWVDCEGDLLVSTYMPGPCTKRLGLVLEEHQCWLHSCLDGLRVGFGDRSCTDAFGSGTDT